MSTIPLYDLVPIVYRLRDLTQGGALEALVDLISDQVALLQDDLNGLWDNLFIETCDEWVVPYIGDLVANTPLYEVPGVGRRADVADTIKWRRRKGTLVMLGELARAVTGWTGTAVAMFELLSWNQNLNHIRMQAATDDPGGLHPLAFDRVGTVDLRDRNCVDLIDTPWDQVTHTVDVRRIADDQGWYGLRKVCFFCYRLKSYWMRGVTPAPSTSGGAGCFHFGPLGQDAPVFHASVTVPDLEFADETNVDAPIRPYHFYQHPELDWNVTLEIDNGGTAVPVSAVICKDLSAWADVPDGMVGVDVRTGRLKFGAGFAINAPLSVSACYGFSAPIGGGPYPRASASIPVDPTTLQLFVPSQFPDLQTAVANWTGLSAPPPANVRIVVEDSATYTLPTAGLDLSNSVLTSAVGLTIAAGDQQRPLLLGDITVSKTMLDQLVLDGLLIAGAVSVSGPVQQVTLTDCTLVPGVSLDEAGEPQQPGIPSLTCDAPGDSREVLLENCITGPLRLPAENNHLTMSDSAIHAPAGPAARVALAADDAGKVPGPSTEMDGVTVLGSVYVRELALVSNSIFAEGTLRAERRQAGCVRFSSLVLEGSSTPRRYRCQPDLARQAAPDPATADAEERRVVPSFTTTDYGQPGYLQLGRGCACEIRKGADDGAEMGVFHLLMQPQRETNLRVRLDEYLPLGLESGIVHVT